MELNVSEQKKNGHQTGTAKASDPLADLMEQALQAVGGDDAEDIGGLADIEEEEIDVEDDEAATDAPETAAGSSHKTASVVPLQQELMKYKTKADTYYKQLLQMAADFDNFRKRAANDRQRLMETANEKIFSELLPILDDFDRALTHVSDKVHEDPTFKGMEMIQQRLTDLVQRFGLKRFSAVGKTFDPNYHQAVSVKETDEVPADTVIEEYQPGYLYNTNLIRPAMVIVARPLPSENSSATPAEELTDVVPED